MATDKKFKFDLFKFMNNIDRGNYWAFDELSEEEIKEFTPHIVMRWMCGTDDQRQIMFMNSFVNTFAFSIGKHKELMSKLLTVSSSKQPRRYKWMKTKTTGKKKLPGLDVVKEYCECSSKEAEDSLPCLNKDQIVEMAEALGYQQDELKKLKKGLK